MNTQAIETQIIDFLSHLGVAREAVSFVYSDDTKTLWVKLALPDGRMLTGKEGETLTAINHVVRKILEKKYFQEAEMAWTIIVDINEYQQKKVDSVKAIAHMMAERARYFKSSIEVDPMPPFERRVIHEFLASALDLKTESAGEGRNRHVVIKYIGEENPPIQ